MLRNITLSVDRRDNEIRCRTLIAIGICIGLVASLCLILLSSASREAANVLAKYSYVTR